MPGSGCLYSTIRDLSLWARNFACPAVGGPDLLEAMLTPGTLEDGTTIGYGLGLDWAQYVRPYKGLPLIAHTGGHAGYGSIMLRFPDRRLTILLLSNARDLPVINQAGQVADAFLFPGSAA